MRDPVAVSSCSECVGGARTAADDAADLVAVDEKGSARREIQ
jgi:hypothetical protein